MTLNRPAAITQFRYFPLVLGYIAQASDAIISFAEIQRNLIRKNYELQAQNYNYPIDDAENPQPPSRRGRGRRTDMYNQLRQILGELIGFELIVVQDSQKNKNIVSFPSKRPIGDASDFWFCTLTNKGEEMWRLATSSPPIEFNTRYFELMFQHFSIVGKLLAAIYNGGENSVIIPSVTARQLGLENLYLQEPANLTTYLDAVTENVLDTYCKFVKHPESWVITKFHQEVRPDLEEKILQTINHYQLQNKVYPRFLIVARIRDYCVSYFYRVLTGVNNISGRSFEALTSRLSKMEILGYSDYINNRGRTIFLSSWVTPFLDAPSEYEHLESYRLFPITIDNPELEIHGIKGELVFHQPNYQQIKNEFEKTLEDTFQELYYAQHQQFISIPDIRENVCLKLKISMKTFDKLLIEAYRHSFSRRSNLEITLSSDRSYVDFGLERWHRAPLVFDGNQVTVARIKRVKNE